MRAEGANAQKRIEYEVFVATTAEAKSKESEGPSFDFNFTEDYEESCILKGDC